MILEQLSYTNSRFEEERIVEILNPTINPQQIKNKVNHQAIITVEIVYYSGDVALGVNRTMKQTVSSQCIVPIIPKRKSKLSLISLCLFLVDILYYIFIYISYGGLLVDISSAI